jgi:acetyltransferase-like isoleucine patch superfamily enzyme
MKAATLARRFLIFGPLVSLYCYAKYGALVSPRSEVELGPNLVLGRRTRIGSFTKVKTSSGPLRIGRDVHVAVSCFISSHIGGIEIGDDCLIGPGCTILCNNYRHGDITRPLRLQGQESKGVRIGSNVQLGAGVVVMDGATIGNGVIVTPNSVVSGGIPDNVIVQGDPARVVFRRR